MRGFAIKKCKVYDRVAEILYISSRVDPRFIQYDYGGDNNKYADKLLFEKYSEFKKNNHLKYQ